MVLWLGVKAGMAWHGLFHSYMIGRSHRKLDCFTAHDPVRLHAVANQRTQFG